MKTEKERIEQFRKFDESNKYWLKVFEIMPKSLQEQIMFSSCFVSPGIVIWICAGQTEADRELRNKLIQSYERLVYPTKLEKERKENKDKVFYSAGLY